jgi:hypothetical protein
MARNVVSALAILRALLRVRSMVPQKNGRPVWGLTTVSAAAFAGSEQVALSRDQATCHKTFEGAEQTACHPILRWSPG